MHQLFIAFQDVEMDIDRGFIKRLEIPGPRQGNSYMYLVVSGRSLATVRIDWTTDLNLADKQHGH